VVLLDIVRNKEVIVMTYEEALKMATKSMTPLGYFPWEIKDAALRILGEECAEEYERVYGLTPGRFNSSESS
jgi:hypothetical protein